MPSADSNRKPTLVIVSGRPGAGKTTLSHAIAKTLSWPLISRDEINAGILHSYSDHPEYGKKERVSKLAFEAFFRAIDLLLSADVALVAEAAFQNPRWRMGLEPLLPMAHAKLIHCVIDPELAHQRVVRRRIARQGAPGPEQGARSTSVGSAPAPLFEDLSLPVPCLRVDTTHGYEPSLEDIVAFIAHPESTSRF